MWYTVENGTCRKIVRRKQMTFDYIPKGVCARKFTIQVEDGVIRSVKAEGGCNGNLPA